MSLLGPHSARARRNHRCGQRVHKFCRLESDAARIARGNDPCHARPVTCAYVKLSSVVVLLSMTVAALSTDNVVVTWADALGSIFVAAFIVWNAWGMLRSSIPDLVDRTAGPAVHETVNNVLVTLAGEYERLDRIRSRRSGRVVFVEVVLTFQPSLTIAEVNERIDRVKRAMQEKIEHLEVSSCGHRFRVISSSLLPLRECRGRSRSRRATR